MVNSELVWNLGKWRVHFHYMLGVTLLLISLDIHYLLPHFHFVLGPNGRKISDVNLTMLLRKSSVNYPNSTNYGP